MDMPFNRKKLETTKQSTARIHTSRAREAVYFTIANAMLPSVMREPPPIERRFDERRGMAGSAGWRGVAPAGSPVAVSQLWMNCCGTNPGKSSSLNAKTKNRFGLLVVVPFVFTTTGVKSLSVAT